ncbi:hypothetical protein OQZ33_07005 [Pedobacter sp. MC2016-05]|uniref:hypothetical protein n=1 Tax=Pedobacter sp. MC2016-05 TaxID=2994474 RepID=UPI002247C7B4|nr:hypothetical protein [Pedobacter sp. MC2016-05]MCX2474073.1 hypothetical protein [Pedobacter sp. MC2016-05]
MNITAYEGLSNKQIQDKVLTELYLTGKVGGVYMKKFSKSKENPIKFYIRGWLRLYQIYTNQDDILDDVYQLTFTELFAIHPDKFVEGEKNKKGVFVKGFFKKNGDLNVQKLTATACTIIFNKAMYKRMAIDKKTGEEYVMVKHSYITRLLHASSLQGAIKISHTENLNEVYEDYNEGDGIILYDEDSEDGFFNRYNFTPDDILKYLTSEEKEQFRKHLSRKFNPDKTSHAMKALQQRIIEIKTKIQNDRNRFI